MQSWNLSDYIEQLGEAPEVELPWEASSIAPVYERLKVLNQVMFPKRSSAILDHLDDAGEENVILVADDVLTGSDMLWLVSYAFHRDQIERAMNCMTVARFIVGNYQGVEILAAPMSAFVKA